MERVSYPETYTVPYAAETREPAGEMSVCTIVVGIAVIALVFWLLSRNTGCAHRVQRIVPTFVNGMRATFGGGKKKPVSVSDEPEVDHHIKVDPSVAKHAICKPGDKKCVHNLTPCTGDDCKDIKKIDPETKKKNDAKIVDFLKEHPTSHFTENL